jgi:hypothetical protein
MIIDRDVLSLFREVNTTILLEAPIGTPDDRGRRTYSDPIKYRAFLQYATAEFRSGTTESRVPRAIITVLPVIVNTDGSDTVLSQLPEITPEFRITLPDGSKPPITKVDRAIGDHTLDHLVIFT